MQKNCKYCILTVKTQNSTISVSAKAVSFCERHKILMISITVWYSFLQHKHAFYITK